MRDLTTLIATCAGHGECIGIYAERLLDDPLPWTRMRSVYRLLGLVRRYGPGPVETALLRCLIAGQPEAGSAACDDQMAGMSSSNAVASRNRAVASTASS